MELKNQQELQKQKQEQLALNNEKTEQMAKMVYRLEMVMAFPLTEIQIENWAETIVRLCPDSTPEQVLEIVDNYLKGVWYFDKDKGIANLTWPLLNPTGADWNP